MILEEPNLSEESAGAIFTGGSDNVRTDEAVSIALWVMQDIDEHDVWQIPARDLDGINILARGHLTTAAKRFPIVVEAD
jgi:hypothetical protein